MNDNPSAAIVTPPSQELYNQLAKEWPANQIQKLDKGGIHLDYLSGEQVVSRLNETLGFDGWSFRVLEHGYIEEADEVWVLGEMVVHYGQDPHIIRQQFGSQQVARRRADGKPLDWGFVLKGATTDALKKCASLVGIGLWLYEKEPKDEGQAFAAAHQQRAAEERSTPTKAAPAKNTASAPDADLVCADCGEPLQETRFKDGTVWTPSQLAAYGRRKHGRVLDMPCYRKANDQARAAQNLESIPF